MNTVSIHATLAGGDKRGIFERQMSNVSIHATLAGGDYKKKWESQAQPAFLSTPPSRVATGQKDIKFCPSDVSIHATLAGGDSPTSYGGHGRGNVSIHATLAGGDARVRPLPSLPVLFLSTPPSRVATAARWAAQIQDVSFYPRHPRGWRRQLSACQIVDECVSIHATLAGGDRRYQQCKGLNVEFLSTPPSRVATARSRRPPRSSASFYPRHPRGWRHLAPIQQSSKAIVSIHATLAGGDFCFSSAVFSARMFLSTPPSRVATFRTAHSRGCSCYVSIHATLAGGDGPASARHTTTPTQFLSTPPSRVATAWPCAAYVSAISFLSTPPSRVATFSPPRSGAYSHNVSIHATLAGGDKGPGRHTETDRSVSIHATLAGGDTSSAASSWSHSCFIHATLAGGDPMPCALTKNYWCFYPRHPRGWRQELTAKIKAQKGFYPRHPRGWRHQPRLYLPLCLVFLSTPPSRVATTSGLASFSASMFLSTPPSRVATLV